MGTILQLVEEGSAYYSKGDAAGFASLYGDDVVVRTPDGRFEGRDAARAYVQVLLDGFPDATVTVGRHCESGDLYLGEWTLRGTNTGPLVEADGSEVPPTGKRVEIVGTEVVRVVDGLIVEHDLLWDRLGFAEQLGLAP